MSYNPLPLYYDAEATRPVPFKDVDGDIVYEPMEFSRLDGGKDAVSDFYLRNVSMGVVEDLEISVDSVDKEGVTVELMSSSSIERLGVQETYHGSLRWTAMEDIPAGKALVQVGVKLMLTQE